MTASSRILSTASSALSGTQRAHLLVGPWGHNDYGDGGTTMGEVEFGLASSGLSIDLQEDLTALQLRWFDHWLKGIDRDWDRESPVRLFLTGENRWLEFPDWPPYEAQEQAFYLQPGGNLDTTRPAADRGERAATAMTRPTPRPPGAATPCCPASGRTG